MAQTVKTFSSNLKIKAKKEVFNIITGLEIENNNITSTSTNNIYETTSNIFSSTSPSVHSSQSGFSGYNYPTPFISPVVSDPQILGRNWIQVDGQINYEQHEQNNLN